MDFSARLDQHLFGHARFYIALAWLVAVGIALMPMLTESDSPFLTGRFGDNDDLLRLKQVKDLLALPDSDPKSWYDLREPRIAPTLGLDSHWSRLLDGALALMVLGFKPFAGIESALWLMQYIWPLTLIVLMLWVAYAAGTALHNRASGLGAAFYLALAGSPAFVQFHPGRIDHHNIQTLLAFAGVAACLRLDGSARRAVLSGFLLALSLAIGYETLPFLLMIGLVVIKRYIEHGYRREWTGFLLAASLGALGLLVAQTAPERVFYPACDALGFNMIVLLLAGAASSLILIGLKRPQTAEERFRLMVFPVIFSVMLGFAYDPTCIHGPYGERAGELWAVWLQRVLEIKPVTFQLDSAPLFLLVVAPVIGGATALAIARGRLASSQVFVLAGVLLISGVMAKLMLRNISYPAIFAAPLIGLGVTTAMEKASTTVQRLSVCLAGMITIPMVLAGIGILLFPATTPEPSKNEASELCDRPSDFEALKRQSRGVVAAPLNLAIPVLVSTSHSVTAAPYHRLVDPILQTIKAFEGDEKTFLDYLTQTGSDYVILCNSNDPEVLKGSKATARLLRGETIDRLDFLSEPPPLVNGRPTPRAKPLPVLVWQVRPQSKQQ